MKVNCCYRLIPNGEAIHSYLDTDTGIVAGMPVEFLPHKCKSIRVSEYNPAMYSGNDAMYAAECETLLLQNTKHAFVIEFATIGYDVCTFKGEWKYVRVPLEDHDIHKVGVRPKWENFESIGYRPTKVKQYCACRGLYRLCYDINNNKVITQDGSFTPLFDVSTLSKPSYNYDGYKDMVNSGEYAVVYVEDKPVFLDIDKSNMTIFMKGGR